MKQLTFFILMAASVIPSVSAQEDSTMKKGNLEIRIAGLKTFRPAREMYNLMEEHGLNSTFSYLLSGPRSHPYFFRPVITIQLSYFVYKTNRSGLGFLINYSRKGVCGYSAKVGSPTKVNFSSTSLVLPLWRFKLNEYWELQAGSAFMVNTGNEDVKPSLGLFSGSNLKIWNSRVSYGDFSIQYLLAIPNKMGPYAKMIIPESRYRFGYIGISLNLGFHTK